MMSHSTEGLLIMKSKESRKRRRKHNDSPQDDRHPFVKNAKRRKVEQSSRPVESKNEDVSVCSLIIDSISRDSVNGNTALPKFVVADCINLLERRIQWMLYLSRSRPSSGCLLIKSLVQYIGQNDVHVDALWRGLLQSRLSFEIATRLYNQSNKDEVKLDKKKKSKKFEVPIGLVSGPEFNKGQRVFTHGNYNVYYSIRRNAFSSTGLDCRLATLSQKYGVQLFNGKHILDIGCNIGHLTLSLAGILKASKVTGIDIDIQLISKALESLRAIKFHFFFKHCHNQSYFSSEPLPYLKHLLPPIPRTVDEMDGSLRTLLSDLSHVPIGDVPFPFNVEFRAEDFSRSSEPESGVHYDTILALSVTKWIHMNSGDDGMKRTFRRIFKSLNPGGYFILEPQSWESYRKKRRIKSDFRSTLGTIQFKPHHFDDFLTTELKFEAVDVIQLDQNKISESGGNCDFFNRPLFVYRKPMCESIPISTQFINKD